MCVKIQYFIRNITNTKLQQNVTIQNKNDLTQVS